MGESAAAPSDGGPATRDGGAGDARAVRRGRRAARPAAQHTAARWRVRTGRASAATSPLSASRADEKQFSTSTEQVRERRPGVGGCGGGCGRRAGSPRSRQEGRTAAEGDALVGAHGRAAAAPALPHGAGRAPRAAAAAAAAALRHGPAPPAAAAPRVTRPPRHHIPRPPSHSAVYHITLTFHYRDDLIRRGASASRSIIDLVFIYLGLVRDPSAVTREKIICDMCDKSITLFLIYESNGFLESCG